MSKTIQPMNPNQNPDHSLITDPIFVVCVAIFAILTTIFPFAAGLPLLMPILQTLFLFVFLVMIVRKQHPVQAVRVLCLWAVLQLFVALMVSAVAPSVAEGAIADGFTRRADFLEWLFAGSMLPDGIRANFFGRLLEMVAVVIGTLVTAGLIGIWLLVRAVNLAGFYAGSVVNSVSSFSGILPGLPIWTVMRILSYICFISICAEPITTGNWSIGHYLYNAKFPQRRRILMTAVFLLLASIVLELILPDIWRTMFAPVVD